MSDNWYLVQCKPREDARAESNLLNQGFHIYRPKVEVERVRKGQKQLKIESLFPSYLFIKLNNITDNWRPLRSTRGVSHIVKFGALPLPVPEQLISNLKRCESREGCYNMSLVSHFKKGEKVKITSGSFEGLEAIYQAKDGEERTIILINLLNRQSAVSMKTQYIAKIA